MKTNNIFNLKKKNQKADETPFGFLCWIVKTELTILLVCFLLRLFISFVPIHPINIVKYNLSETHKYTSSENYSYDRISSAIKANNNLSEEEKDFCNTILKSEIDDNYYYIDINQVEKRLSTFKIEYVSNSENEFIHGKYNKFSNTIYLYSSDSEYSYDVCNKEELFHELNHLISNDGYGILSQEQDILLETINELFTRMYYLDYDRSLTEFKAYNSYMKYAYNLCELLPESIIKEYKFSGNKDVLVRGLLEIDDNIDKAYELIDSISQIQSDETKYEKKIDEAYKYFYDKK